MKVLLINSVFNSGSTGKIVFDLHRIYLDKGIDSIVCYGRGISYNDPNVHKVCSELYSKVNNLRSRITGVMYGGCFLSTYKLINIIKETAPDVVHLHCLNGYFVNIYSLIEWLKENKIKTILTLHAEFMYTGGCGHSFDCNKWLSIPGCGNCPRKQETKSFFFDNTRLMWKNLYKAFEGFDNKNLIITSVSPWLEERASSSPILKRYRHKIVFNGLDTSVFKYYPRDELKKAMGLVGKKVIFHASPSFNNDPENIKGGYYLLNIAKKMQNTNVVFVIAGLHPPKLIVPNNVILLGEIKDKTLLASYYSLADFTLLTSKKETFSMVVAESLCCGTPVIGFEAGAPEQIAIREYSRFVEFGNENKVIEIMNSFNVTDNKKTISQKSGELYSKSTMAENYISCYYEVL